MKWVGYAYSDAAGTVIKVILRGPTSYSSAGTVGFFGSYRCIGSACAATRGSADVVWWNDASTGLGWQSVDILFPAQGVTCTSLAYFLTPFYTLPPPRGTQITVPYQCTDTVGFMLDNGTVSLTRRR
jgi:hypothetical protein